MVAAILAVWKCGAAYLLLKKQDNHARQQEVIGIASPKIVLADDSANDSMLQMETPVVFIEEAEKITNAKPDKSLFPMDTDLCYVFFTSGSTGVPKGALIEHRGAVNHMLAKISDISMDHESRMAQTATTNFNIFNWQVFGALSCGASVIIYSDEVISQPARLINSLVNDKISYIQLSPSYLDMLLRIMEKESVPPLCLKMLLLTGETVKATTVNKWFDRFPNILVLNSYGCTEVSDDSLHCVLKGKIDQNKPVPIGRPIPNTYAYAVEMEEDGTVIIRNNQPVLCPQNKVGLLWLAGDAVVGRKYINNDEETKRYFCTDPFSRERMFKIEDLVYINDFGEYVCLGRKDSQVKINGKRVDLAGIETHILSRSDEIEDVCVVSQLNDIGQPYLISYFSARRKIDIFELRGFKGLLNDMPDHMIPTFWVQLDQMPLLPDSGKKNKKALPLPRFEKSPETNTQIITRSDPVEKKIDTEDKFIAQMWSDVLAYKSIGISPEAIGVNECFFNLGGDSLSLAILEARLNEAGYDFDAKQFSLASAIKEKDRYLRKKSVINI